MKGSVDNRETLKTGKKKSQGHGTCRHQVGEQIRPGRAGGYGDKGGRYVSWGRAWWHRRWN
jgi:hypothetical protein